jgi:hypothetical protein
MIPRESLGDLAREPLRSRICCHAKRYPKPAAVPNDNEAIEDLESDCWQDEEVDRCDAVGMVAEKRPPALRGWPSAAAHISSDRRLRDLEAELEQFTMNAWCAPQRVRAAHIANERAQLGRNLRSSRRVSGSPAPIRPKATPVPADDRFRSDDRNRAQDGREPVIEPNEQKTIGIVQSWSLWHPSPKNVDLLPQGEIFRFYRRSRPKERSQEAKNQLEHERSSRDVPKAPRRGNCPSSEHLAPSGA